MKRLKRASALMRFALISSLVLMSSVFSGCGNSLNSDDESRILAAAMGRSFDSFDVDGSNHRPWTNSLLLAKVCEASKLETAALRRSKLAPLGLDEWAYIDESVDSQALIASNSKVIVIASPGTGNILDGIHDMQIRFREPWNMGFEVHNGFYRKADAIEARIREAISQLRSVDAGLHRTRAIWLTGHSQGGSIMQLIALRLKQKGIRVTGVITYGSPKAGDSDFQDAYNDAFGNATHRWINEEDPVPGQPRRNAFKHVGRQHYIDRSLDQVLFNDREERDWRLIVEGFDNHGIAEYIRLIDKYMP